MKAINQRKELRQKWLNCFSEVMRLQSFSAAAISLNSATSIISDQIKLLEKEVGTMLFERCGRNGVKSNEAADMVLKYHRECLAQRDYMETCLQELRDMMRGKVCIVAPTIYVDSLMEDVMGNFCSTYPDLDIEVNALNPSEQIMNNLLEDLSHIGIINNIGTSNNPINSNFRCCARAPTPICMLVNKKHPLANKRKITFKEAASYPLALPPYQFSVWQIIQDAGRLKNKTIEVTPAFTTNSVYARKKFVIDSDGTGTFLSTFAARREINSGQLIALEINHPAFISVESFLIVRRRRPLSPAVKKLVEQIASKSSVFSPGVA